MTTYTKLKIEHTEHNLATASRALRHLADEVGSKYVTPRITIRVGKLIFRNAIWGEKLRSGERLLMNDVCRGRFHYVPETPELLIEKFQDQANEDAESDATPIDWTGTPWETQSRGKVLVFILVGFLALVPGGGAQTPIAQKEPYRLTANPGTNITIKRTPTNLAVAADILRWTIGAAPYKADSWKQTHHITMIDETLNFYSDKNYNPKERPTLRRGERMLLEDCSALRFGGPGVTPEQVLRIIEMVTYTWERVGEVSIDSGQLMICDPAYPEHGVTFNTGSGNLDVRYDVKLLRDEIGLSLDIRVISFNRKP